MVEPKCSKCGAGINEFISNRYKIESDWIPIKESKVTFCGKCGCIVGISEAWNMDSSEKEIKIIEGYIEFKKIILSRHNQAIFAFCTIGYTLVLFLLSQRDSQDFEKIKSLVYLIFFISFGAVMFITGSIKKRNEIRRLYEKREKLLRT